jgi:Tfp pilus assembly protein PilF
MEPTQANPYYICNIELHSMKKALFLFKCLALGFITLIQSCYLQILASPGLQSVDPQVHYRAANELVKSKRYQEALDEINEAIELNPNYYEAWLTKAVIFQLTGHTEAAIMRLTELVKRRPNMIEARINLGLLYKQTKEYKNAEIEFRKAIEIYFYNFSAHYNLANLLLEQNKMEEALKQYRICLKLSPDNAMAHNNMGVIYLHKNYLEEAEQEFLKASHLDPANQNFADNLEKTRIKLHKKSKRKSIDT